MKKVICCIFPAFGNEYIGNENKIISNYSDIADNLLNSASNLLNINFTNNPFSKEENSFNELSSQYLTYIFSCILSNILKNNKTKLSEHIAGYSMGIYAALYHAESISFEDGLLLIKNAYQFILKTLNNKKFSMGTIIGLEYNNVKEIINNNNLKDTNIININNKHSVVISGLEEQVKIAIDKSKEEGALSAKLLPISAPYHSDFLKHAAEDFKIYLDKIKFENPIYKFTSSFNQKILNSNDDIKNELMSNIFTNHNWHNTMKKLISSGYNTFFECGPGKSLFKIGKFIDGDFKIHTIKNLDKIIDNEY